MAVRQIDLIQGTLDLLVLKSLTSGPNHGYAIAMRIHQLSDDVLRVEEGSLYPALYRMEEQGLIESEWRRHREQPQSQVLQTDPQGAGGGRRRARQLAATLESRHTCAPRSGAGSLT